MKRKSIILLDILMVLSFPFAAFAESGRNFVQPASVATASSATPLESKEANTLDNYSVFQPLSETDDYEEIKVLESEMLERANALYSFGKLNKKMTASDIDYNKAVKIYMDHTESVFNDSMADMEKFRSFLDTAEHIWVLQVSLGNQTVTYTFNIGRPVRDEIRDLLTSEQIEEMEREAGHWKIVKVAWGNGKGDDYKDYIREGMAQENLRDESSVVVIGGTPEISQPLAITYEEETVKVIPTNTTANDRLKALMKRNGIQSRMDNPIEICDLDDYIAALN